MVEDTLKGEDLWVYGLVKQHGPCTAYDLIRIVDTDTSKSTEERFRFAQGIHGRLSGLEGSFVEALAEKQLNPTTGKLLKVYQITKLAGVVGKLDKSGNGYKAKYEEALEEIKALKKEMTAKSEFFILQLEKKDELIDNLRAYRPSK